MDKKAVQPTARKSTTDPKKPAGLSQRSPPSNNSYLHSERRVDQAVNDGAVFAKGSSREF